MSITSLDGSVRIMPSLYMTRTETATEVRTWRDRLLTLPWRPWVRTRMVSREVPRMDYFMLGDFVVCHPAAVEQLRVALSNGRPARPKGFYNWEGC